MDLMLQTTLLNETTKMLGKLYFKKKNRDCTVNKRIKYYQGDQVDYFYK